MKQGWFIWVPVAVVGLVLTAVGAELEEEVILLGETSASPSARATGLGGAYTAVADDYSASYWNPAGLAQIRRIELYGSIIQRTHQNQALYFGTESDASTNFTKLSSLGVVFPVPVYRGALVFAVGYNLVRTWDRITSFNDSDLAGSDIALWKQAEELENGRLGFWSLAMAMDLSPSVSLGGGLQYWVGKDDYTISGEMWNAEGTSTSSSQQVVETGLKGWRGSMGVLVRGGTIARLGMVVMSPVVYDADEDWTATDYGSGSWGYRIGEPFRIRGGMSLSLGRVMAAVDLDWMDWSQIEYRNEPPFPGYSEATANIALRRDYRATLGIHGGVEVLLPVYGLRVRAGGGYDPDPEKGAGSANGKKAISLGLGALLDQSVMVDLAYAYQWWEREAGFLSEDVKSHRLQMSIAYRF